MKNTRLIYYEISLKKDNNVNFKGVIDIEINQIILNTNENFKKLEPLTNYSIFAIKESNAYEIYFIDYNKKYDVRCPSNTIFVLNNKEWNHCESTCRTYILETNGIFIDYCNNTIYSSINENNPKICGFYKDLNE